MPYSAESVNPLTYYQSEMGHTDPVIRHDDTFHHSTNMSHARYGRPATTVRIEQGYVIQETLLVAS